MNANIFCNNCGQRGHAFRDCKEPILSCGIMLLRDSARSADMCLPTSANTLEVLMVRRKDSMSFAEFVRGKYDPANTDYVNTLLSNTSQSELTRLQTEDFTTVWSKMWGNSIIERRDQEFHDAREKFRRVKSIVDAATTTFVEPEWGFPKGRRLRCETDQGCAEREFFEETNILRTEYCIVTGLELEETFRGTNNVPYRHKYFIALLRKPHDLHQVFTSSMRQEVSAIAWMTLEECGKLTRPQYVQRDALLRDLAAIVETVEVRLPNE